MFIIGSAFAGFIVGVGVRHLTTQRAIMKDIKDRRCRFCGCRSNGFCVFPKG
jgi:hypothetical protein